MGYSLDHNGHLDIKKLQHSDIPDYIPTPKNKNDKVRFAAFTNSLGSKTKACISTRIGFVNIRVNSQFHKMLHHKENRQYTLMHIKPNLKKPFLVSEYGGSYFFFGTYKKNTGELIHLASVCRKIGENEYALMTNYKINKLSKIEQILRGERGRILYVKDGSIVHKKEKQVFIHSLLNEEDENESLNLMKF